MNLAKALKLKKGLTGDIARLKEQIKGKNSYLVGSQNGEKFNVRELYDELLLKIDELTGLKFAINEANREIQSKIYVLSEYKALISFWNGVSVAEGTQTVGYDKALREYKVQIDETERDKIIKDFQKRIDALQDEIDVYNFTTDIPWDEFDTENSSIEDK